MLSICHVSRTVLSTKVRSPIPNGACSQILMSRLASGADSGSPKNPKPSMWISGFGALVYGWQLYTDPDVLPRLSKAFQSSIYNKCQHGCAKELTQNITLMFVVGFSTNGNCGALHSSLPPPPLVLPSFSTHFSWRLSTSSAAGFSMPHMILYRIWRS